MNRQEEFRPGSDEGLDEVRWLFKPLAALSGRLAMIVGEFPPLDVYKTEEGALLVMEAAGMDVDNVELSARLNEFEIRGDREVEEASHGFSPVRVERFHGPFQRALELPFYIDEEQIRAEYKDGILRVLMKSCMLPRDDLVLVKPKVHGRKEVKMQELPGGTLSFLEDNVVQGETRLPSCDIMEDRSAYLLCVDLPGVCQENLDIAATDDSVTIYGEPGQVESGNGSDLDLTYGECESGAYGRTFRLSAEVDGSGVSYCLEDGLLKVRLPKRVIRPDFRKIN